jgi:membrane-bound ClpP family serine protease
MGLATIGLVLIVIGWLFQAYESMTKKKAALTLYFVLLYVFGCLLLFYEAFTAGLFDVWVLNLLAAVLALASYFTAKK